MKTQAFLFALLILFLGLEACHPVTKPVDALQSTEEIAREIIMRSGTCTLISLDSSGYPKVRVMDPFPVENNFEVWFGTNPLSRKVAEIRANPNVAVHYYDKPGAAYVSLYGLGEVITDPAALKKYWKPAWKAFYRTYPANYALIHVVPNRIELVSAAHGIPGDSITWKPVTIILKYD